MSSEQWYQQLEQELKDVRGSTLENSVHIRMLIKQGAETQKLLSNLAVTQQELKTLNTIVLNTETEVRQIREQLIAVNLNDLARRVDDLDQANLSRTSRFDMFQWFLKNLPALVLLGSLLTVLGLNWPGLAAAPPPPPAAVSSKQEQP